MKGRLIFELLFLGIYLLFVLWNFRLNLKECKKVLS